MKNRQSYFETDKCKLYQGDCFELLKEIPEETFDMVFADPPYFLSDGGISCKNGKQVSVNKGEWDNALSLDEKLEFNKKWIKECYRVLKKDGTLWVSGTFHNIYAIGVALESEGFSIINNITWEKPNPVPNLACRCFTNSTETILWARKQLTKTMKGKHTFNYEAMKEMNGGKQMKDVWIMTAPKKDEKKFGHHPTQKPIELLNRIILASTNENDLILDPFCGSGTTLVSAIKLNRRAIGIEKEEEYLEIAKNRLLDCVNEGGDA